MFCAFFNRCIQKIINVDQAGRHPVFRTITGSTETPGHIETGLFFDRTVAAYEVFTVPSDKIFILEYVSAAITRGDSIPYPPGYLNDYGAVGYELNNQDFFHLIPFMRSEPGGMLLSSQSIHIAIPQGARVVVKVPIIPSQSGGATVRVSGYYLTG